MEFTEGFRDLPLAEQRCIRSAGSAMAKLVFRYAAGVLVGPPPGSTGRLNSGSAFVVLVEGRAYLGTAWHVVQSWRIRTLKGEKLLFQVGDVVMNPVERTVWCDEANDIVFLHLERSEVSSIGILPCEPLLGWPPPKPVVGDFVLVVGYPGFQREHLSCSNVNFRSLSFLLSVTNVGEHHVVCQFEREQWISTDMRTILPKGVDLGGMSGGPAMLVRSLAYPLIGHVSEHNSGYEIMRITMLSHAPRFFEKASVA